jgi:glycosyltransferase involved in cell wall biosynthesis
LEVLVIDSGSPENESAIVGEYVKNYPENIKLVRTEREPLYVAWNRALGMATGKYVTNANTDDRHRTDALECLVTFLEANPKVALTYASQYISRTKNETYQECVDREADFHCWPKYTQLDLLRRCITGSQPLWRRELHSSLGLFDTSYTIAADYEMWLRIASKHDIEKYDDICGVMYFDGDTISGVNNRAKMNEEVLSVQRKYMATSPWNALPSMQKTMAKEIFGLGYQLIRDPDTASLAKPFVKAAIELQPFNWRYYKTYALRCLLR